MAKYSRKIRLAERSAVIRADIEMQEELVRVEENQERNRITGLEDQMARLVSGAQFYMRFKIMGAASCSLK